MAYPLNTFNGAQAAPAARPGVGRFAQEVFLVLGLALLIFMVMALASYSPQDGAWSTSGAGGPPHNWAGKLGAWLADLAYMLLGFSAWWCVAAVIRVWWGGVWRWMHGGAPVAAVAGDSVWSRLVSTRAAFWVGLALLLVASTGLEWSRLYRWDDALPGSAGGIVGAVGGPLAVHWLGFTGSALLGIAVLVLGMALVFRFSWSRVAERIGAGLYALLESRRARRAVAQDLALGKQAAREREEVVHQQREVIEEQHPAPVLIEPAVVQVPKSERVVKEKQKPLFTELPDSPLPQVDLLDGAPARQETVAPETLEMTSRLIEKKLKDFGVEVRVVAAAPGPVITRYEIEPATGVKGSQIVNLAKDLARTLSVISIRVVEAIPGKHTMGLEIPNPKRQIVRLSEILGSQAYADSASPLTVTLGKDIAGNPVVADLGKMPHLLVAGTTGSGKSVGVNAMILSLVYKADPSAVRMIMVDPKMLELSIYEGIPHLLAPVVTDMKQAASALNWCVAEMERRYKLLSAVGVRNLAGYNQKVRDAKKAGTPLTHPFSLTPDAPEPLDTMPMIVVMIDELADLMMVVGKKVEELIARLAQKARAAGIHLILATQRPSVDVITGLIKANIPTRIAFQVSSKIDSRTILDQMGAEALLGQGDMLYLPPGTGLPQRVHGAFVSDAEVHRVVDYLKALGEPDYVEGVLESPEETGEGGGEFGEAGAEADPLYDQAVAYVLKSRRASISSVQRQLRIGYNRAARMIEDMERAGLVSAMQSNGNRDVLAPGGEA